MLRSLVTTDLPAGPPPEVLAQIDVAWERSRDLFDSEFELHFEIDSALGRVWAELRNADGELAQRLTASEALAFACGDELARIPVAA